MTAGAFLATAMAAATLAGAAAPAQAETLIPGVTSCGASGVKQERGALLGAVAGGLIGNSVSGHNRTTGTVVGAVAGAAAGSAVGCQMQHNSQQRAASDHYGQRTYRQGGYDLYSGVAPASYKRVGGTFVATSTVNLRAAPAQGSSRVGQLRRGERFEALAKVRGTDWILVGRGGVGVGYVHGAYAHADGYRYASY
ncbi:SH3 domain-containing protein [Phenylobacterium sp. LjRoot225]